MAFTWLIDNSNKTNKQTYKQTKKGRKKKKREKAKWLQGDCRLLNQTDLNENEICQVGGCHLPLNFSKSADIHVTHTMKRI